MKIQINDELENCKSYDITMYKQTALKQYW